MKRFLTLYFFFQVVFSIHAWTQEIVINDNLKLIHLTNNVFMHTSNGNNGIVYFSDGDCLIVSTPASTGLTTDLINWIKKNHKTRIVAWVIDRWHPDAMGGLKAVQEAGIPSYAYEQTRKIAEYKNLPVPDKGFNPLLELKVGKEKVICHFLGEAHTNDGIVVWIPEEKVLFGGNEIRNYNGIVGNIADANINEWSNTIRKVKDLYGTAEIVVPGHGAFGGPELIDYTIELYTPGEWGNILRGLNIETKKVFNSFESVFEIAASDSVTGNNHNLYNAKVLVKDASRIAVIESYYIEHQVDSRVIKSPKGRLKVYNKSLEMLNPVTDVYFERLTVKLTDDEVGMVIIIKRIL